LVDSLLSAGSDFIKIRTVLNEVAFAALGRACKERGVTFSGHIDRNIDLLTAVKAGIGSIEHTEFFHILKLNEAEKIELAKSISAERTFYTPTLIAEIKNKIVPKSEVVAFVTDTLNLNHSERALISSTLLENWKLQEEMSILEQPMDWEKIMTIFFQFGSQLVKEGVPTLAGTDCGLHLVIPGLSLHEELELMVDHLKMSNLAALQSATINAASYLKRSNEGVVRAGASADLLLLDANPLENISNTQKISVVIKSGNIYTEKERVELMQSIQKNVKMEREDYKNELLDHYRRSLKKLMNSRNN
jgi:hypothetical protein